MKTRTPVILALALALPFTFFYPLVRAQQEHDDPNWLERSIESLKKAQIEIEKLKRESEENRRESERMRMELERAILRSSNRPRTVPKLRFFDIYDARPIGEIQTMT